MQIKNKRCDLADYGLLKVSGMDAKKLLQGQLTCDIEKLQQNEGCMGAHCNPQGRIISLFYIFFKQDAYYLVMLSSMINTALLALKKYAIFYKTELTNVSDDFCVIGFEGKLPFDKTAPYSCIKLPTSYDRYLIVKEKNAHSDWCETLAHNATRIDSNTWKCLDIHDKIPSIHPETSSQFLPHELNLTQLGAISFEKGCYTGQEIIARMHYRGKLKTSLAHVKITENKPLLLGSDIHFLSAEGRDQSGILVDICQQENNDYHALIIVRT